MHLAGLRLILLALPACCAGQADSVTIPDALYLPNQTASSDRAAGIGKRVQPGGTLLWANIQGPAIIRHLWMTNLGRKVEEVIAAGKVVIQFYWDGHDEPDLSVPLSEFFGDRFSGSKEISFHMVLGKNAYYAMPFRKSARIEIMNHSDTELVGVYWQIDYDRVDRIPIGAGYFTERSQVPAPDSLDTSGQANASIEDGRDLPPRGRLTLADLPGPSVIRRFRLSYDRTNARDDVITNRGVIVRMFWDGEPEPSVDVPLADFFGTGFGERRDFASQAWVQEGLKCEMRFPMPFQRAARIELVNLTDHAPGRFTWRIDYEQKGADALPSDVEYLHACFRMSRPVPLNSTHVAMETRGRGKFVGLVWSCHWINAGQAPEGTQNFWIDGVRIQATGSEDYFGRAWGFGQEPECHGYKGINLGPEKSAAPEAQEWRRVTAYRVHVLDPIRFQQSLKLDFTCYGYNRGHRTDEYSTVCFWYQAEPHTPFAPLPEPEDLLPLDHSGSFGFGLQQIRHLERAHDHAGAIARIDAMRQAFPDNPRTGDLQFKQGCLLQEQGRQEEAAGVFRAVKNGHRDSELSLDAADQLWLLERPGRVLVKAAAPSAVEIYLDGTKLSAPDAAFGSVPAWGQKEIYRFTYPPMKVSWGKPSSAVMRLPTIRVDAGVGRHVIAVRASVAQDEPIFTPKLRYFFASLDLAGGDIVTGADWKVSATAPAGWESAAYDDSAWRDATVHPLKDYADGSWQWLWPRGFRNFPGRMERIWDGEIRPEDKSVKETLFFRKQFEIPK